MSPPFKKVFLTSAALLYLSGVGYMILDTFVKVKGEFGSEHHPLQAPLLHVHGIVGLVFLVVFGHLYATHIRPGLRGRRRKRSGYFILIPLTLLALSVPALYYPASEELKNLVAGLHTYLGLAALIPFGLHFFSRSNS